MTDKPKPEPSLIEAVQNGIDAFDDPRAGPYEQAIAAITTVLDYWRAHDPCDIVLDGDGSIDSGGGPVCDKHRCRKGGCPIDTFEAKHGLQ